MERTSNNCNFASEKTARVCAGEVTSNLCETIGHVGAVQWKILSGTERRKMVRMWRMREEATSRETGAYNGQPVTPQSHIRRACYALARTSGLLFLPFRHAFADDL